LAAASSSKKHTSDINKHKGHETVNAFAKFGLQINRLKDAQIAKTIQEPPRARRTRDLETVFTDVIHKEDQKYRICRVCNSDYEGGKRNKHLTRRFSAASSSSTLRKHISRMGGKHWSLYLKQCSLLGIVPDERATPKPILEEQKRKISADDSGQQNFYTPADPNEPWTVDGMLRRVEDFIIEHDLDFSIIDSQSFRDLMSFQARAGRDYQANHFGDSEDCVDRKAKH